MDARNQYQQAGLLIYGDDDNYAKMVLQARGTNDHANRVFQFIREENGVPNEVAASNSPNLGDAYPDTVYVRFVSDGANITAHYSQDGATFTAMTQTKALAGITNPRIGLVSLAGSGTRPIVDAAFDWFHITPDDKRRVAGPERRVRRHGARRLPLERRRPPGRGDPPGQPAATWRSTPRRVTSTARATPRRRTSSSRPRPRATGPWRPSSTARRSTSSTTRAV